MIDAEVQAGPLLDALVAERVFGDRWGLFPWVILNDRREDVPTWLRTDWGEGPKNLMAGRRLGTKPPPYSTNIAVAWLVVERMRELGYGASVATVPGHDRVLWDCWFSKWEVGLHRHVDPSAPLAICRAALAALAGSR